MNLPRPGALLLALGLAGCATPPSPPSPAALAPPAWQAPLPHGGQLAGLSRWWHDQGDPLLASLVEAAQAESPGIAAAGTRIAAARARQVAAGAALLPSLDAVASSVRTSQQSAMPMGTTSQAALQASWEIDLFGARRAERRAASERLEGAGAGWHEARVSVAAEVANLYYQLRACERLLAVARQDAESRAGTARLATLTAEAGLMAPATSSLANASAADAAARATAQQAQCDILVKAMVALTAVPEPALRERLAATPSGSAPTLTVGALPARVLAQRPDVYAAEREVAAASADIGSAQAQRYPRLTLQGSVGAGRFHSSELDATTDTWSIGPLALTLPLFDGGRRRANVDMAKAWYEEAARNYRASVRNAVREVEEALVAVRSAQDRSANAHAAMEGYRAAFDAAHDRYRNGMASLLELEDARRTRLAAENAVIALEQQRNTAWVALYRALGGGWHRDATATPDSPQENTTR